MSSPLRSACATALAQAKIAVSIGLPTAMAVFLVLVLSLEITGRTALLPSTLGLVGLAACALLVGLQVAVEVAAISEDGTDALRRGSSAATAARYVAVGLVAGATALFLLGVTGIGLSAALGAVRGDSLEPGLLIGLAGAYVLYRGMKAFIAGIRSERPHS
ncbi:hypothetical protein [Natronolimnobius baerhuensis]|uniref:Uncharacterized protein n=1 Tax=Natronolimnobius baerhuensis TaxID=253108 RepID=A0A202EB14_9EURY|nr:hypothetical protein [Natronolimnobius baerhuensis]OVE85456.1 hypothetical protein B2G88_01095 [Natronolimnobius baerhuensis]